MTTTQRKYRIGQSTLCLEFGDIATSQADVLVSSDDCYLTMGGGVSAAIRRAAGEAILLDVAKKIPAELGDVVVTSAGSLPAKHVFHAVTVGQTTATARDVVASTTLQSLQLLKALRLSSIAFPAIGAGAAGFAYDDVAATMAEVIADELGTWQQPIEVTIYLFDRFRRMQPIDYVQFFENFAARSQRLLTSAPSPEPSPPQIDKARPAKSKRKPGSSAKRTGVIAELAELDSERQTLESRLAHYGGSLARSEVQRIEKRLREIQHKRVELLSEVSPRPSSGVSVFLSYSHVDETWRKELGKHLSVLERQGIISTWHDRMIGAGSDWERSIDAHLDDARVVLLLISADFIHSRYCYDIEMKRALERHERRQALVIPVILRAVSLKGTPFAKLQALPRDAKPVSTWTDRDSAFVDITDGLRDAIQDLVGSA